MECADSRRKASGFESKIQLHDEVAEQESDFPELKEERCQDGSRQAKFKEEGRHHPKKWKAPKQGDKKEVKFKGHTWYWCSKGTGGKCEKWRAHKPKECKGLATSAAGDKQNRELIGPDKRKLIEKKLKVAKAYIAEMEQFEEKDTTTEDEDSK
jgi:hypothetical protein